MRRQITISAMILGAVLASQAASATNETNFQVKTTRDLVTLCSTAPDDPVRVAAINFCHGFAVGAYQYHLVAEAATGAKPLFCLPSPTPSRNETIAEFVTWANAHPDALDRVPVDSIFRFLAQRFPCPT